MSSYTSIILFISPGENLSKRMQEVNDYKMEDGRAFSMIDLNGKPYPDVFPRFMLCGAYNNFNLEHFLMYLRSDVFWEEPQNVRLIVQDDLSENVDYYSL
jgi:hypothetical protein